MNFTTALVHEPEDQFGEAFRGPILERKNRFGAEEDALAVASTQSGRNPCIDRRIAPVFVKCIHDGDAVSAENVEEAFNFVLVRVGRAALQEPLTPLRGESNAMRNPG